MNKVNQKLQDLMGEEIKKLKEEQKMARKEIAELSAKEVNVKQDEEVAKKGAKITETASRIEEIELYKEHVRNLLSGEKVISRTYPKEYYSILKDELTTIIEKKLKAYVEDDEAGVKKTYQSLNSKKERIKTIKRVYTISVITIVFSFAFFFLCPFYCHIIFGGPTVDQYFCYSLLAVPPAIIACAIAGIAFLIKIYCWKGFAREIEDFIEGPKHVDKATNTENEKELEQTEKEQDVEDLIDLSDSGQLLTPSAPPLEEEVKERMYPIFDLQKELDSIEVTSFTLPNTDLTQKK
ncbi:hypothetical protein [Wolbachia endosymbiont of Armadillidium arcangelii]|uniref:Uncharacterized protein n=1 Tax=Wolbachia endosymbiont of Armadillidium arcangelii TaxID=3158571 RepID=A0AAU7Q2Q2_9RICK